MEAPLSLLLDALPGLVWASDLAGRVEYVNRAWCEYSGLSAEESAKGGILAATHADDASVLIDLSSRVPTVGSPSEGEIRLRRFDGEYRWFLVRLSPLSDSTGKFVELCGLATDIDAHKRAETGLRTLQTNFQAMCEAIPGLVCTMNTAGEVEVLNRPLLEYFGKTTEELVGHAWAATDAVHPDDLERVLAHRAKTLPFGLLYDIEHRCRRFDGVYRWFNVRALPVRNSGNAITGWFVLLTDIEDRKRAEEAIVTSERNLKVTVDTIPAAAWSALPDGSCDYCNQQYLNYIGLSLEEALGVGWTRAVHPDDLAGLFETWGRIMASGKPGEAEARVRRADGEYRWLLFRANPFRDDTGNIVKWYGVNTDINDRKRVEDALRRSEAFLAEGERLNLTGTFSWKTEPDELTFSEQSYRIFDLSPAEPLTLERIATRVHPEDHPLFAEQLEAAHRGKPDVAYEVRLRMPDESIKYVRSNAFGSRNRDGRFEYVGAFQDVTERRLSEEALGKVRSELAYMTRVASLGALTASIAHEVNQPLAGIITNANTCLRMLAADPPNVDGARETARRTIRDGNRASDVIIRLRALFARKELGDELVDLNEATREVIALSASELQRARVFLKAELEEGLPRVVGDRVQLQQVILNLLVNGAAAMSEVVDRRRQLSVHTTCENGEHVCLAVQDVGVGIDPQTAEHLFDAFYTTKADGMGLGLSVSRSIIESHGGKLWAESNEGPGATFRFRVPCAPGA